MAKEIKFKVIRYPHCQQIGYLTVKYEDGSDIDEEEAIKFVRENLDNVNWHTVEIDPNLYVESETRVYPFQYIEADGSIRDA